jgi:hypothetical protein
MEEDQKHADRDFGELPVREPKDHCEHPDGDDR